MKDLDFWHHLPTSLTLTITTNINWAPVLSTLHILIITTLPSQSHYKVSILTLIIKSEGPEWRNLLKVIHLISGRFRIWTLAAYLPRRLSGKEFAGQCWNHRRHGFDPWVRKILWRRRWQPIPEFLLVKSHRQRSLAYYIVHGTAKGQTLPSDWVGSTWSVFKAHILNDYAMLCLVTHTPTPAWMSEVFSEITG